MSVHYVGQQACVGCHSEPDIVGANKAVYEDYLQTGHASKLITTYDNPGYRDYCLPCHVTGYDESAMNDGFDDRLRNAGWDSGSAVSYLKDVYPTIADFLAAPATLDVQTVMNVQCEACHGPGTNHPEAEAHLSFGAGTCKQCHHQPVQWALSPHSAKPASRCGERNRLHQMPYRSGIRGGSGPWGSAGVSRRRGRDQTSQHVRARQRPTHRLRGLS